MMKYLKQYILLIASFAVILLAYSNCSQSGFGSGAVNAQILNASLGNGGGVIIPPVGSSGGNVVSISVGCGYVNEPCVSVTVCIHGTTQCQTINNLLLDTGSTGLRIFSGAISSLTLPGLSDSSGRAIGTCAMYGDGTYQWGPVKTADVQLGSDVASNINIEIIDFTFGDQGTKCKAAAGAGGIQDAMATGYNGILGVQGFMQDCGSYCTTSVSNDLYYGCSGTSCSSETVTLAQQLVNPVGALSADNNGMMIQLPAVSVSGGANVTGAMYLGIGTQSNNTPASPVVYQADANEGFIYTNYNGHNYQAIIDSGSMGYFFPDSSIPTCTGNSGWYCPTAAQAPTGVVELVGQMKDVNGANAQNLGFYVADANRLYQPNTCFNDLAGPMPAASGATSFIWGFPFFTGRSIYLGMEGATSTLGSGIYYAF